MPPDSSKPYPLTRTLYNYGPSSNSKDNLPRLESSTTLAHLSKEQVDPYLKQVIRHLKEPFEQLVNLKINGCIKFVVSFSSAEGIHKFGWEFTIMQLVKTQHATNMLHALEILSQGLFLCSILLRNVAQLVKDPKTEEIHKLGKLKKRLSELTGYLDRILITYSTVGDGESSNIPTVEEVKRLAKKLHYVLNNLKPERLHNLMPEMSMQEEDILCSVLGLQSHLAGQLASMNPDTRGHQSDMYFLLGFLEEDGEYSESLTDTNAVAVKLQEMGFTEHRSTVVAEWIASQPLPEHQSLFAWVHDYITSLFKYDIFLNDVVPKYPYEEGKRNEWFPVSVERYMDNYGDDGEDDDRVVNYEVNVINTTPDKVCDIIKKKEQKFQMEHPGRHLYFHGTDHGGGESILEVGINLGANKRWCDFSDGLGFYLTDDSQFSVGWAQKNESGAIILFDADDCLSNYRCLDLSSSDQASELEMVKEHYRTNAKLTSRLREECHKCDYIKGPITQVGLQRNPERAQQICIRSDAMANCIGNPSKIHGVIFISKNKL